MKLAVRGGVFFGVNYFESDAEQSVIKAKHSREQVHGHVVALMWFTQFKLSNSLELKLTIHHFATKILARKQN